MEELKKVLVENGPKNLGASLISNMEEFGFGVLSKSDFEAFMFHQLLINIDKTQVKRRYDLMKLLKITPSKLRSLEMTRSAKFLNLDLDKSENWQMIFNAIEGKKLETEDKENGKVRIYIDDLHVHRLIERFVVEGGSSIDYTMNRNQLVIKYVEFLYLLDNILLKSCKTPLLKVINEDRSSLKIEKEFDKLESIFKDMKEAMKDKAYDKIAEIALTNIIKIAKKKIGL
jgi:hypothetical protein